MKESNVLDRHRSLLALCLLSFPVACAEDSAESSSDAAVPSADASPTDTTEPTTEPTSSDATTDPTTTSDGGDELPHVDAGNEAGTLVDSGADPSTGTEPTDSDSGSDAGGPRLDAGPNAPIDAGSTPSDASTLPDTTDHDAAITEDGSAPPSDGGSQPSDDPWAACPSATDFVGDPDSPVKLEVSAEAVYCATFLETRTLKEEFAAKAQLRFTPGTYSVPDETSASTNLPSCVRIGNTAGVGASSGSTEYSTSSFEESVTHALTSEQTFEALSGGGLSLRLERTVDDGSIPAITLDGSAVPFDDFNVYRTMEWCNEPSEGCFPDRIFQSCQYEIGQLNRHEVSLDSGNVVFELRLGQSFASTEPGAYVRASGSFEGQAFDQTDYFKLIYHPTHHHFERAFVVLFDEPIEDACGIEVSSLEPFGDDVSDQAFAVDCELNHLYELSVEDHTLIRE